MIYGAESDGADPSRIISRSTASPTSRRARRTARSICSTAASAARSSLRRSTAGTLPQVTFYKPQGNLNEHHCYTDVASGDQHIADVHLASAKSPQWNNMLVVATYDENGGFWDHVAPPRG